MVSVQDQAASLEPAPCSPCCIAAGCSPKNEKIKMRLIPKKWLLFFVTNRLNIYGIILDRLILKKIIRDTKVRKIIVINI